MESSFLVCTSWLDKIGQVDKLQATPHKGSRLANSLARISALFDSPRALINLLRVGSETLQMVTADFRTYYESQEHQAPLLMTDSIEERHSPNSALADLNIVSFQEKRPVRKASGIIQAMVSIALLSSTFLQEAYTLSRSFL